MICHTLGLIQAALTRHGKHHAIETIHTLQNHAYMTQIRLHAIFDFPDRLRFPTSATCKARQHESHVVQDRKLIGVGRMRLCGSAGLATDLCSCSLSETFASEDHCD